MSTDPNQDLIEAFPIGTPVLAWPGTRNAAPRWTKTRSEPWQLGHGDWVVAVDGVAGGVALTHVEHIPDGWMSPEQHRAEVDRLTIEAREETATRAERWARAHFGFLPLGLIAALAEPVRDYVAEADAVRKQRQGISADECGPALPLTVLCNSCGRALANVGEWCCNRFTTAADVTNIGGGA